MVLVKTVLYEGLNDTSSISAVFPGRFQTMQWSLSLSLSLSLLSHSQYWYFVLSLMYIILLFSWLSQESQGTVVRPHCQKHVSLWAVVKLWFHISSCIISPPALTGKHKLSTTKVCTCILYTTIKAKRLLLLYADYTHVFFRYVSVSLPRLVNFDWRVDVKTSSDSAARMAQPTCIVQMKVSL